MNNKEGPNKVEEAKQTVQEAMQTAEEAGKLAAAAASGNVVSAAKSAIKLAKSSVVKKALKRKIIEVIVGMLAVILIALSFYAIIMTVQDKLIQLSSNLTTAVTSFWKWMTDDYWIKLDKEIEFSYLDEETRSRNKNKCHIS